MNNKKININNDTDSINLFLMMEEIEKSVMPESELSIIISNSNCTESFEYKVKYSGTLLSPKNWLLHSLLYFLTADETRKTMFKNLIINLTSEM